MSCKLEMILNAKRKSHAGRKPAGPFAHNTSQLTIRMPDDLRSELETAAKKKGWSLTQELLWRVRSSYRRQREEERRPPATRALCFLISEIAVRIGFFKLSEWHRSTFAFRAFRLAVGQLLETLEPTGEMKNPFKSLQKVWHQGGPGVTPLPGAALILETPESLGAHTAKVVVDELRGRSPDWERHAKEFRNDPDPEFRAIAQLMLETVYGMADARRDMGIQGP
jgi:hypothetical protein